ncbi:MAG TPA: hypothetical protein VFK02_03435 [Kofleriaceae bacterium]|nr:hypothetical protein [Kofleriaceae bacterium]
MVTVALAIHAAACAAPSRPPPPASAQCRPAGARSADVHVVAHEDDDLLFMNPDISTSIARGNHVVTIYLTAGATSGPADVSFMVAREKGILNAYAYMVAPVDAVTSLFDEAATVAHWTLHDGAPIQVSTSSGVRQMIQYDFANELPAGGSLSVVFLRLFQTNGEMDLRALWDGRAASVPITECAAPQCPLGSVLPPQSYSRDQLIETIAALLQRFHVAAGEVPLQLSTLDATQINIMQEGCCDGWQDNADHVAAAQFTIAGFVRYHTIASAAPRSLRQYRGYSASMEPVNLDADLEGLVKRRIYYRYDIIVHPNPDVDIDPDDPDDPHFKHYELHTNRKYATITVASTATLQGRLETAAGQCLTVTASGLRTGACNGAPEWQITPRSEIRLASDPTQCVMLGNPGDDLARLDICRAPADAEPQSLVLTSNGQIRARGAGCLDGTDQGLQAAACIGLLDAGGHPLRRPVETQDWTLLFSEPHLISTQFSDSTEIGTDRSYFRTLTIADGQICLRRPAGPGCARYRAGAGRASLDGTLDPFATLPAQPAEYTDAQGWRDDSTGSTLSFTRLLPSGPVEVCGRGYYGIRCGTGTAATWWTTNFSTSNGWASSPSYYGSIRLADVDGDGYADVCGRGFYGISCGTGNGAGFNSPVLMTSQFSNDGGWNPGEYGDTMQFADLDGDGCDDVCGRSIDGMHCALSDGSSFIHAHTWSFNAGNESGNNTRDFGDSDPAGAWPTTPAKYRSIRLVDINRDGLTDVCGRDVGGIWCALSTGSAFESKRAVVSTSFTDSAGWNAEAYGSTLSFGRLDGNDRIDMCARGMEGIWCSEGP